MGNMGLWVKEDKGEVEGGSKDGMEDNSRVDMVGIVEVEKMVDIGVVGGS
jgi:hypothetical protein